MEFVQDGTQVRWSAPELRSELRHLLQEAGEIIVPSSLGGCIILVLNQPLQVFNLEAHRVENGITFDEFEKKLIHCGYVRGRVLLLPQAGDTALGLFLELKGSAKREVGIDEVRNAYRLFAHNIVESGIRYNFASAKRGFPDEANWLGEKNFLGRMFSQKRPGIAADTPYAILRAVMPLLPSTRSEFRGVAVRYPNEPDLMDQLTGLKLSQVEAATLVRIIQKEGQRLFS